MRCPRGEVCARFASVVLVELSFGERRRLSEDGAGVGVGGTVVSLTRVVGRGVGCSDDGDEASKERARG